MMLRRGIPQGGYTLIELVTTLSVASALAVASVALADWIQAARLTTKVNTLIGDLALARSEAIKRGHQVVICKSRSGTNCEEDAEWHQGWILFADTNENEVREAHEPLLRVQPAMTGMRLKFGAFGSITLYVAYSATGFSYNNGTFTFCPSRLAETRRVVVGPTGRPRIEKRQVQDLAACHS
jgi:type IV fimbrial biogenesis protein FimT